MAFLELCGVSKSYGEGRARTGVLADINLSVEEGEFVAIVGFSGSGKTTLISIIAGLVAPDTGTVLFKGAPVTGPGPDRGVVFQSYSLMPWLSVAGNVALAVDAVFSGENKARRRQRVEKYVGMVGLEHAVDRRPAELSGGMRQRVAVARALAMDPDMLLLDEPLSALDALTRGKLQDEIERIWEQDRKTVIMITNDVDEAIVLADRIIPLTPGPRATLGASFKVDLPRPRDRAAMNDDPQVKALRADVPAYLMDVGIAAKVAETRRLPAVTPRHALPRAYAAAAKSFTDDRYLQFSHLHKIYPTAKGPLTVVEDFNLTLKKGETTTSYRGECPLMIVVVSPGIGLIRRVPLARNWLER